MFKISLTRNSCTSIVARSTCVVSINMKLSYAGAYLHLSLCSLCLLSRKTRRRSRGESLDLGGKGRADAAAGAVLDSDGTAQDVGLMMKDGRVSLGKIKKGAKVMVRLKFHL